MAKIRVAVQLANLGLPFKKALHTAAELGADAVEIDARGEAGPRHLSRTGLRQLRKMLNDLNLRVAAVTYRTRRGYDAAAELERRIDGTKLAQRYAFELGASVVVNHVGLIPAEAGGPAWELLVQSLVEIGYHGQRVGAVLAAVTGQDDGPCLARLIQALPPGSLGVTFDPGSLIIHGFSPSASLAAVAQHVVHVHARDAVRDVTRGRGVETALGRGSADLPEVIGTLEEQGYRGYFTLVCDQSDDPVAEMRQAISYLRNL